MINKGATLDEVKAARVTADYDPLYGAITGPWTTDMFVEAIYESETGTGEDRRPELAAVERA